MAIAKKNSFPLFVLNGESRTVPGKGNGKYAPENPPVTADLW
jgi:hypothetical protein